MRLRIPVPLRLIISISLVSWFLANVDWSILTSAVVSLDVTSILITATLVATVLFLSAVRWHILIPYVPLSQLTLFTIIGAYYSVAAPGQLVGEFLKILRFAKGRSDSALLTASILFDKFVGLSGQVFISALALLLSHTTVIPFAAKVVVFGSVAFIVSIACILMYAVPLKYLEHIMRVLSARQPRLAQAFSYAENLSTSWRVFARRPMTLISVLTLSMCIHVCNALIYYTLAHAMNISVSLIDWIWLSSLVTLLLLLPITIAGIGLREGALIVALGWFGVSSSAALALSLTAFSFYVFTVLPGIALDIFLKDHPPKK